MFLITWETLYNSQFRVHANGSWVRAGKIKVKIMDTTEQVFLNIFIVWFFFVVMMDYAPQASSVPATLFFFFFLLLEIQRRDWHLEILELWNVNLYASVTRSLFYMNKWTSTVRQKWISSPPTERANETKHFSFYLQAFIFDTSISAIFVNVTFSLPVAMQHANN